VDGTKFLLKAERQRFARIQEPLRSVWRYFNVVATATLAALVSEWDYERSLSRVRKEIFPEEVRQACARSAWYTAAGVDSCDESMLKRHG